MAGISYKDVALVNGSLDQIADSLIKQRALDLQEKERGEATAARVTNTAEHTRHNRAMEGLATGAQDDQRKQNAQKMWGDTVRLYGNWVGQGIMDPDQAQNILQQSYQNMPDQAKSLIADHPSVQAIMSGEDLFSGNAGQGKDIKPQTTQVTLPDGRKVDTIYNKATGSFHIVQGDKEPAGPRVSVDVDASGNPTKRTISGRASDVSAELQGGYLMTDPDGNTVRVPTSRYNEMKQRGYVLQK